MLSIIPWKGEDLYCHCAIEIYNKITGSDGALIKAAAIAGAA